MKPGVQSTLARVADVASDPETLSFAVRNFLDSFYAAPSLEALEREPVELTSVLHDNGLADAYLAGIAEHLARMNRFPSPPWTKTQNRFLENPWFAFESHAGRMFLLTESPVAFRRRNIFINADALTRA
jgi:hypothetical protein